MSELIQLSLTQKVRNSWQNLSYIGKVVAIMGVLCLGSLVVYYANYKTIKNQIAEVTTPPATPPIDPYIGLHLETSSVLLHADSIDFIVGNQTIRSFNSTPTPHTLFSENLANDPHHTNLRAGWTDQIGDVRLHAYFEATTSTQRYWRLTQISTEDPYNGTLNWYSYSNELYGNYSIQSPVTLNTATLYTPTNSNLRLQINNLYMLAFIHEGVYPSPSIASSYAPTPSPSSWASPSPSITPACVRNAPLITLTPWNAEGMPGDSVIYTVHITNYDTQSCGSSLFALSTQVPSDFTTSNYQPTMWIPAGGTAQTSFKVNAPLVNPWNEARSVPISYTATNTVSHIGNHVNGSFKLLLPRPQAFEMFFKLAGVKDGSADGSKATVKFYLKNGTVRSLSGPLTLYHAQNDTYKASVTISNPFPLGTEFRVKVKAEKHVAIEFCKSSGQTVPCKDGEYISIGEPQPSIYTLSFTGIPLPPGDLSPQDGRAGIDDLNRLKPLMGKAQSSLSAGDLLIGDVNYDNYINIFDVYQILRTMENRYDD